MDKNTILIYRYQLSDGSEGEFIPSDLDLKFLYYKLFEYNIMKDSKDLDFKSMLTDFVENPNEEIFKDLIESSEEDKIQYIEFAKEIINGN